MTSLLTLPNDFYVKRRNFGFFEDFEHFVTGDLFTDTSTDANAAVAMTDAVGGQVTLTVAAVDNDECYLHTTKEIFKFAASKPIKGGCRLQYAEGNTDDANVLVGFKDAFAANTILDNGAGPAASYSGMVFFKVDGGTNWNVETSLAGTQQTTELTAANSLDKVAKTAGGASFQWLEIEWTPISSTSGEAAFYIDGTLVYKQAFTYTSGTEMMFGVGLKAGGATAETVTVDAAYAYQVRT